MAWNESKDMYVHTHFFNWKRDCVLQPELSLKEVARRLGEMWRVRCALESFCIQVLFLSLHWLTNWFSFISPVTHPCAHFTTHSSHPLTHSVSQFPFLCVQNMDGERKKFYSVQAEATRKVYTGASLEPSLYVIGCGCTSVCYDFLRMEASSCVLMNVTIAAQMGEYNRALADYHTKLAVLLPKVNAIVLHNRRTLLPQNRFWKLHI